MAHLRHQPVQFCSEDALHVIRPFDVPGIAATGFGHRNQQVFVEAAADADGRGRDVAPGQLARLCDDAIYVRLADIRQPVRNQDHAIDSVTGQLAADFKPAAHPGLVQRRRVARPHRIDALLDGGFVFDRLARHDHFDAVVSGFVIRNLADVAAGIAEQARVLRPGGRMVILETTPDKILGIMDRHPHPSDETPLTGAPPLGRREFLRVGGGLAVAGFL